MDWLRAAIRRLVHGRPCPTCGCQPCQEVHLTTSRSVDGTELPELPPRDLPCPFCGRPIAAYLAEFPGLGGPWHEGRESFGKDVENPYKSMLQASSWLMGWCHAATGCPKTAEALS